MTTPLDPENGTIRFSTKELLASIQKELKEGFQRLDEKLDSKAELTVQHDHEQRIRRLEKFRYSMPSIAVISLVLSIAMMAYILVTGNKP